jgi:integrase/recombinase XerD
MKSNGASERHQNNNLKAVIAFANFLGTDVTFLDVQLKEQIMSFLDTKIKNVEEDPDKKWMTTWNDYLHRIKHFFRWLYNQKDIDAKGLARREVLTQQDWETPPFAKIREKRSKRISPYLETELWERDELLSIIKYEPYKRNKAALALFWDLDARNHEVTLLKIKHIRLKEQYGEGEIPHESKTGIGPILLTLSFPYVRDWLNEHPFRNTPDARVICNLHNGAPVKPEAMWMMMKQLCNRIIRMLEDGSIRDNEERQNLEYLL